MDGRFGRCVGCEEVKVFCCGCASVGARCDPCSAERRRWRHREANRTYSQSARGRASGRRRQARFRALRRGDVTDTISTEEPPPPTSPSPSASIEATRTKEVSTHESTLETTARTHAPLPSITQSGDIPALRHGARRARDRIVDSSAFGPVTQLGEQRALPRRAHSRCNIILVPRLTYPSFDDDFHPHPGANVACPS